jgi:IclR family transcriptional regulator, blcABC operon repressor
MAANGDEQSERDPAPAVTRSIKILGLLADAHGRSLALSDIARSIGAAKSSTSNLCVVLEEHGLIQRRDSGFILGRRTVELGGAYIASFDQVREFYRLCLGAALLSHQLVQIAILDGTEVLYLARHEGRAPLRLSASIGDRFPAASTAVGNALLSLLSPDEVADRFSSPVTFPQRTERSTANLEQLQKKLELARERGYAIDDGEVHPGVYGIAMIIPPRASGEPALAIGVSLVESGVVDTIRESVISELRGITAQLSYPLMNGNRSNALN